MKLPQLSLREEAQLSLLSAFYARCQHRFTDQEQLHKEPTKKEYKGCYVSIASPSHIVRDFAIVKKYLKQINPDRCPTFADIGAGLGGVVALAHTLGFDAHAYEIREEYTETLNRTIMYDHVHIGNAFKVDKFPQDVIYLYQPMRDSKLMNELLTHVVKHTKKDVIFIYMGGCAVQQALLKYVPIGHNVYSNIYIKK